jgi:hypothetical protein
VPETVIVWPPAQVIPLGQSSLADQLMHVVRTGLVVQADDVSSGEIWVPVTLEAHPAIVESVVVLSNGWPLES